MRPELMINVGCDVQYSKKYNGFLRINEKCGPVRQSDGVIANKSTDMIWDIQYNKNERSLFAKIMMAVGTVLFSALTVAAVVVAASPDIILSLLA